MPWIPDHIWYKQKKGKGKGKGWGGGGGGMDMMMMMPMMQMMMGGGGGGYRKGVKKWHKKQKYSELSDERKEEIKAKHAEKATEEGRKPIGNILHEGTIVKAMRGYGWIKPSNPFKLPKLVKDKMKEMTAEKKSKAVENKHEDSFDEDILYFRKVDVEGYPQVKLSSDMSVKFKVYIDEKGAGAFAVVPPAEAKID
mmetsp:Transcript_115629/g.210307  ORF Transcript_115629/g.210307 Transcript_115629/m.210307 type:complete len:196 (-) Transcript_115629:59-646(-)